MPLLHYADGISVNSVAAIKFVQGYMCCININSNCYYPSLIEFPFGNRLQICGKVPCDNDEDNE